MKKYLALILALALFLFGLVACDSNPSVGSSTTAGGENSDNTTTSTSSNMADNTTTEGTGGSVTTTTKETTATTTNNSATPPESVSAGVAGIYTNRPANASDPYYLKSYNKTLKAPTPVSDGAAYGFTSDGRWYYPEGMTVTNENVIFSSKGENGTAYCTAQFLGDKFTVGGSFAPVQAYNDDPDSQKVICSRMVISDENLAPIFLMTVQVIKDALGEGAHQFELGLQIYYNGNWRQLLHEDWIETKSTKFYMQLSYDGTSADMDQKISMTVYGDKEGKVFDKTSPKLTAIKTAVANAAVAGYCGYSSCVDFFYVYVNSNTPHKFTIGQ